jgi:hypothetical protein
MLFRHVAAVIGKENVRAYFRTFRGRMGNALRQSLRVHPRARTSEPGIAQRRGLIGAAFEIVFLGLGWFFTGRPFIGIMLASLGALYLTIVYVVVGIAGNSDPLMGMLLAYLGSLLVSSLACYRTYRRDVSETPVTTPETSEVLA